MPVENRQAFEATAIVGDWTLLADFRNIRTDYYHMQLLTPLGTKVLFSFDRQNAHIICRSVDHSVTFDNRPARGQLWCRVEAGAATADCVLHIW